VIQYAADDAAVVAECHRVLKARWPGHVPGLQPCVMAARAVEGHEERRSSTRTRRNCGAIRSASSAACWGSFVSVDIVPERFPVKSRLHKGWKGTAFNLGFVGTFNALPRAWTRRFGWHLLRSAANNRMSLPVPCRSSRPTPTATTFCSSPSVPLSGAGDLRRWPVGLCDRHRGIGADGLMTVDERPLGASVRLLNCRREPFRSLRQRRPLRRRVAGASARPDDLGDAGDSDRCRRQGARASAR
jgi:hypothetical protein